MKCVMFELWRWRALALVSGAGIAASSALGQGQTNVSGRVVDQVGAPIVDASIAIGSPAISTRSKTDGRYTLVLPAGVVGPVVLSVRRLGFRPMSRPITARGEAVTADFTLESQPTQLSGMSITALGILAERTTIGTSQQTLSAEELTRTQANSVIGAMSGKVSGVQINQSGNIGGSTRIVIRGAGSILGQNQPLFILDGLPISNAGFSTASSGGGRDYGTALADLNPDDIASMTVLKGPNAAALYGSRAANGAVVITTKSGRSTITGTQFSFVSRMTVDAPSILPSYQNQYGQGFGGAFRYVDGAGGGTNDGADESWGPKLDGRTIDQFFGKAQPWIAHPDNVRDFFRTGSTISNTINVAASGTGMGVRLSLTSDNTTGIVPNSSVRRLGGTLSGNVAVNDRLQVSGSLLYTNTDGMNRPENGYTEGNPFMGFTWFGRQVDVNRLRSQYVNTNSVYGFADGTLFNWNNNYHRNPFWQQDENPAPDSRDRQTAQLSVTYKPFSWLNGLVRGGLDAYRFTREERFAAGNINRTNPAFNGGFTSTTNRARETNIEGLLTAKKELGMLALTINAGGNIRKNDGYAVGYSTAGILVPGIYNLSNAGITPSFSNNESHSAVNSAYGSVVATLNRAWTVEVTGRNDWSSTLPKANASYFYPSINTSFVLSDLFPRITSNRVLSFLKVRGAVARVGSDAGAYQLQTLYFGSSQRFAGQSIFSLSNVSANPSLRPERTSSSEGGIDASFLDDRIITEVTYFSKRTRDQIIPLTVSPSTGFTATTVNAGQISNRGVEASISWNPLRRRSGLNWTTSIVYTRVRNRVDELAPGLTTIVLASDWDTTIEARQGLPYGTLYGYGYLRDSATGQRLLVDGLPQRAASKSVLGNVNPEWVGGWTNQFRFRRWALSTLVDVQRGGQNFSIGNWWGTYAGTLATTLVGREVEWNDPGYVAQGIDQATGTANTVNVTAENYHHAVNPINEAAIFSTGFAKLREARLSYDVPPRFAARLRLSQLNLALVGRNLFTWTSFPNYDPENSANSGNGSKGFDMGSLPTLRSFGFNVSLTP